MCSGTVRTICSSTSPAGSGGAAGASRSPVTSCQRMRKCSATSATAGPSIRAATSCQPTRAGLGGGRVEAVAGLRGQVDAADERDPVVDDDRLLVVAVQGALVRVERALDARPSSAARACRAPRGATGERAAAARLPTRARARRPARPARRAGCARRPARRRAQGRSRARSTSPSDGRASGPQRISRAIVGSASAPSMRISSALPGRGEAHRSAQPVPWRRVRAPSRFGEAPPVVAPDLLRDLLAEQAFGREKRLPETRIQILR